MFELFKMQDFKTSQAPSENVPKRQSTISKYEEPKPEAYHNQFPEASKTPPYKELLERIKKYE